MTTAEAAAVLGISRQRVRRLLETGRLAGELRPSPRGPVWEVDERSVQDRAKARGPN